MIKKSSKNILITVLSSADNDINLLSSTRTQIRGNNAGKGPTANKPLDKTDLELQHGKGNVEQGGGNYKETKNKILDNQAANQKANESSKFGDHVAKEQQINAGKGTTDLTSKYSGNLVKVNKPDPAADALAQRIGGESRVRFTNDIREFDVISDSYVAQTKPALKQLNAAVRNQMKATFEAAKETNRSVYYHFEGLPAQPVINKLNEYSKRYCVKVVIDTKPLNLTK